MTKREHSYSKTYMMIVHEVGPISFAQKTGALWFELFVQTEEDKDLTVLCYSKTCDKLDHFCTAKCCITAKLIPNKANTALVLPDSAVLRKVSPQDVKLVHDPSHHTKKLCQSTSKIV